MFNSSVPNVYREKPTPMIPLKKVRDALRTGLTGILATGMGALWPPNLQN